MARNPRQPLQTKKHLARLERERRQRRYILIGSIVVALLVVAVIVYGILEETYLTDIRPVAVVNGEKIMTKDFQAQTRYYRTRLIDQAGSTAQLVQMFGNSPELMSSIASQLYQIQAQLEPTVVGEQVVNQMVNAALIRQEAERRGITVTEEEINKTLEESFGYFPNGTPTPTVTVEIPPTSTPNPTSVALLPPTATATITPTATATATLPMTVTATTTATPTLDPTATITPTITPTALPTMTPTPFTLEAYEARYDEVVKSFEEIGFTEKDLRYLVENQLYTQKVMDAVLDEMGLTNEQEFLWARHILVADEATAKDIRARLDKGEDWNALAAEFSTDESNKDKGGDLGWFGPGKMVKPFEDAARALDLYEISQPVQTDFGWHIIQLLGREVRTLTGDEYEQLRNQKFQEWLDAQKEASEIEIRESWKENVPAEPTLPPEIEQLIQQGLGQQGQQGLPPTTP